MEYFLYNHETRKVVKKLGLLTLKEVNEHDNGNIRAITKKQLYVELSLDEIVKDVNSGDLTAIEGLLQTIDINVLKCFLPE